MAKSYTPEQFAERLARIADPKKLGSSITKPFRKHQKTIRAALIAEYWKHPLGSKIWKWRQDAFGVRGGPAVKLGTGRRPHYPRWSHTSQAYVAPITVTGMAAEIEEGGHLRRHVFWGRGSRSPGAVLSRMAVFDQVVDKEWERCVNDMSDSFWKFVERTL